MSDELVEQLRFLGLDEAADEIERLRNEILRLRQKRMAQSHEIAVLRSKLAQLESETVDPRRDLPA